MKITRTGVHEREDLEDLVTFKSKDFMSLVDFCHELAPDKRTDRKGLRDIRKLPHIPIKRSHVEALIKTTGAEYTFDDVEKRLSVKSGDKTLVVGYE